MCAFAQSVFAQNNSCVKWDTVATFSILDYESETGEVSGASQTSLFSVGNGVLWGAANVGIIATQAIVDVSYGTPDLYMAFRH